MRFEFDKLQDLLEERLQKEARDNTFPPAPETLEWYVNDRLAQIADKLVEGLE